MADVQLTMVAMMIMMMCWTTLQLPVVTAHLTTGPDNSISRDDVDDMLKAARQEMTADVMRTARQETEQLMSAALERQSVVIEELTGKLEGLTEKLKGQNTLIEKLEQDNTAMKQDNVALKHSNVAMEQDIVGLKKHIEGLIAAGPRHDDDLNQVAFSVVSEQMFGPVEVNTNVPFEIILTNIGGNYSPVSNAFQAGTDGVYMFTGSILSSTSSSTGSVLGYFTHSHEGGQTRLATMWANQDMITASATSVIVELAQGDYVSIQLGNNGGVMNSNTNRHSTFSGFLLFT